MLEENEVVLNSIEMQLVLYLFASLLVSPDHSSDRAHNQGLQETDICADITSPMHLVV